MVLLFVNLFQVNGNKSAINQKNWTNLSKCQILSFRNKPSNELYIQISSLDQSDHRYIYFVGLKLWLYNLLGEKDNIDYSLEAV